MKTHFSLALLATYASASVLSPSEENEFIGFAAKFNKHYETKEEMADRIDKWQKNKNKVNQMNKDNENTGVKFSMNVNGDLSNEEF